MIHFLLLYLLAKIQFMVVLINDIFFNIYFDILIDKVMAQSIESVVRHCGSQMVWGVF
jgi:hypothetical protein